MRENKKGKSWNRKNIWFYGLGAMGLALLVATAFLAPKLVLQLQDNVRCSEVVTTGELESMDITSFNTGYETDLYTRLLRFAEGLGEGRQYYVAAQELADTLEVEEFLASEKGLYQRAFLIWLEGGVIPEEMLDYELTSCKQYVIYGDDFSDGVNFILWYMELGNHGGTPVLKLLMDAETGDIYGIRSLQTEDNLLAGETLEDAMLTLEALFGLTDGDMQDMWYSLAYWYGGLENTEVFRIAEGWFYMAGSEAYSGVDGYVNQPYLNEDISAVLNKLMKWEISEEGNRMDFLFPYGRNENLEESSELCFRMETDCIMVIQSKRDILFRPKNFTVGFPEIYERIPEFAEDR